MSSKGLWCSLIALCAWSIREAGAQLRVEQIPLSPVKSNTGFFLYGADNLKKEIPNSSLNGTPFWNTEFITATIYLEDGQPYSKRPVKLNIATNEINFLNKNSEEFIAQNGIIKKIVFHPSDSSDEVRAIFRNDIHLIDAYSKYKGLYIQELNQGKTQLLKISRKIILASDSLFGTRKKYAFHLEQHYFLMQNAKLYYLRKLNRKEVVSLLYIDKDAQTLIEKNNLNLAKEQDVLTLLEHLNK